MTKSDERTARAMEAAQLLKHNGYEDMAALLVKAELEERQSKRKQRERGVSVKLRNGCKARLPESIFDRIITN